MRLNICYNQIKAKDQAMKTAILFIGTDFFLNGAFVEYVKRKMSSKYAQIDSIEFFHDKDKELFLQIARFHEMYENLLIVTTQASYATAAKIVATIFDDNLTMQENLLAPSKADKVVKDSFLIKKENHQINMIRTQICEELPQILLQNEIESATLHIFDLEPELFIDSINSLAKRFEIDTKMTKVTENLYMILATNGEYGDLAMFVQHVKSEFPQNLVVAENLFEYLIDRFTVAQKRVTFAESCTGGLLASMLTKVPGSSNIFHGSMVTYANEIKHAWLGVSEETLRRYGAVSHETVEEMIEGSLRKSGSDYAIAISGIAGPGGGSEEKPVGTVFVGCGDKESSIIHKMHFKGDRNYIQYQAAMYGVKLLLEVAKEDLI